MTITDAKRIDAMLIECILYSGSRKIWREDPEQTITTKIIMVTRNVCENDAEFCKLIGSSCEGMSIPQIWGLFHKSNMPPILREAIDKKRIIEKAESFEINQL